MKKTWLAWLLCAILFVGVYYVSDWYTDQVHERNATEQFERDNEYIYLCETGIAIQDNAAVLTLLHRHLESVSDTTVTASKKLSPFDPLYTFTDGDGFMVSPAILKSQLPIWVRRHNGQVQSYNERSLQSGWQPCEGHNPYDRRKARLPKRIWQLNLAATDLIHTDAQPSRFSEQ